MRQAPTIQFPPLSPVIKKLIIINLSIWFVGVLILQKNVFDEPHLFNWLGLIPADFIYSFKIWQPFTYMFLHSLNMWHILFNMLMLWWLGTEVEQLWGRKRFLSYYLICGAGAALLYTAGVLIYGFISGDMSPMAAPVVGASGAIFGLIVAYGILFSEREIYFLFVIKMKAKHFVMLLGAFEVVSLLSSGFGSQVANLAHLAGAVVGYLLLVYWSQKSGGSSSKRKSRRRLKLVVDNESTQAKPPKYWN